MNLQQIIQKMNAYERLMRLDKPIGMLLLLWPTAWALLIATNGLPYWPITLIFFTGTVLMRSAGCVLNDIADREYDGLVTRTKDRPLATGEVNLKEAYILAAILVIIAFIGVCFLNSLTIYLSFAALFLAVSYPYTKRFLALPQAYLGIAFGFGIPMAFSANTGQIPQVAWLLLLTNIFWAIAYDTEYAMVDREDDLKIGIQSSAIFFGQYDVLAVMLCYVAMLGLLVYIGQILVLGVYFSVGLAIAAVLVVWQYHMIKTRSRTGCFKAFMHNNWIGCAIFLGLLAAYV